MDVGTAVAGRYRLVERVGAGGMGEVWRASDEVLGRTVAVKVMLWRWFGDPDFERRFLAEARAMASVHHPGVVAIHDFGEVDVDSRPVAYIVMEYVAGEPLSAVLARVGRLGAPSTMDVVSQTALALQAVHHRGVVHRDIKPSNLMIRPDGSLALTDFGISAAPDRPAITVPGQVIGTPKYLSPEQVMGLPSTPLSDVYALGVVAYECLAGRPPFDGENPIAIAMQIAREVPPPLPPDVPPRIANVVMRALAREPSDRWLTAAEFALAAERAARGPAPSRPAETPSGPPSGGPPPVGQPFGGQSPGAQPFGGESPGAQPSRGPSLGPETPSGPTPDSPSWTRWPGLPPQGRARRRWPLAVAAAVVALLAGVAVTLWATGALKLPAGTGRNSGTPMVVSSGSVPAGFAACDEMLCPAKPMCWRGLVQQSDRPLPPGSEDCTAPHYWETFAVIPLPGGVTTDRALSTLMERPDVANACSAKKMAERSRDPALTQGWRRDAWPIPTDAYTLLVHCLAGSPDGERPGAVFQSG